MTITFDKSQDTTEDVSVPDFRSEKFDEHLAISGSRGVSKLNGGKNFEVELAQSIRLDL